MDNESTASKTGVCEVEVYESPSRTLGQKDITFGELLNPFEPTTPSYTFRCPLQYLKLTCADQLVPTVYLPGIHPEVLG